MYNTEDIMKNHQLSWLPKAKREHYAGDQFTAIDIFYHPVDPSLVLFLRHGMQGSIYVLGEYTLTNPTTDGPGSITLTPARLWSKGILPDFHLSRLMKYTHDELVSEVESNHHCIFKTVEQLEKIFSDPKRRQRILEDAARLTDWLPYEKAVYEMKDGAEEYLLHNNFSMWSRTGQPPKRNWIFNCTEKEYYNFKGSFTDREINYINKVNQQASRRMHGDESLSKKATKVFNDNYHKLCDMFTFYISGERSNSTMFFNVAAGECIHIPSEKIFHDSLLTGIPKVDITRNSTKNEGWFASSQREPTDDELKRYREHILNLRRLCEEWQEKVDRGVWKANPLSVYSINIQKQKEQNASASKKEYNNAPLSKSVEEEDDEDAKLASYQYIMASFFMMERYYIEEVREDTYTKTAYIDVNFGDITSNKNPDVRYYEGDSEDSNPYEGEYEATEEEMLGFREHIKKFQGYIRMWLEHVNDPKNPWKAEPEDVLRYSKLLELNFD